MSQATPYIVRTFPVGPLQCNCTVIGDPATRRALVIDPGGNAADIQAILAELQLVIVAIIHTHAHLDHILAAGEIKKATGAPIYLHRQDMFLWRGVAEQCAMFGVPLVTLPDPDHYIEDDHDLGCCGGVAMHTPGHTPGSTSFWFEPADLLIAGDTLFRSGIGRTDLPGGNHGQIIKSIRERLYTLNDNVAVVTGHGPGTTIGDEKYHNRFVRA